MQCVFTTSFLYVVVPIGVTVFPTLKRAPEAMHHLFKIASRSVNLSNSDRKTVVSSANKVVISRSFTPGISKPFRPEHLSMFASGSMAMSNRRQDIGSPCLTPRETTNGVLNTPLTMTRVSAFSYKDLTVVIKLFGELYLARVLHR